jgi:hypothetical protein
MNVDRFDALVRSFRLPGSRRAALRALATGFVGLTSPFSVAGTEAKHHRKKKCPPGEQRCGKKCRQCCEDADCGSNERCTRGKCEPCLDQGADCTDDSQCCTGICDKYTDRCQQVRVSCAAGESCPNGRCCHTFGPQCLYETATQGECDPEVSCGYLVCGKSCDELSNGKSQFCGFEGSAACRKGRCCCPKGIPLEDCPDVQAGSGTLPRCD